MKNKKQVALILDKSASMSIMKLDVIGGVNEFIKSQQQLSKDENINIKFGLTLFNTQVENRYVSEDINKVELLTVDNYRPEQCTALYDSIGLTVTKIRDKYKKSKKKIPDTLCVIFTDGEENSSREYNSHSVKQLIQELTETGKWSFAFMGANQDAWTEASKIGILHNNTIRYGGAKSASALNNLSNATASYLRSSGSTKDLFKDINPNDIN